MLKMIIKKLASLVWISLLILVSGYIAVMIIYTKNYYQQVYIELPQLMLSQITNIEKANVANNKDSEMFLTMSVYRWYPYQTNKPWILKITERLGMQSAHKELCVAQRYRLANPLDKTTAEQELIEIWSAILAIDCSGEH